MKCGMMVVMLVVAVWGSCQLSVRGEATHVTRASTSAPPTAPSASADTPHPATAGSHTAAEHDDDATRLSGSPHIPTAAAKAKPAVPDPPHWTIRFGNVEPPVVMQTDITVRAPVSNESQTTAALECSGLAWADGYLLLTSDRHGHVVFVSKVDLDAMTVTQPEPHVVIGNEQELLEDGENLTLRRVGKRWFGYEMCSMSNDIDAMPLPKRRNMLRFEFTNPQDIGEPEHTVINLTPLRETLSRRMTDAGVEPYVTFNADQMKNTYRWANTEGIAFISDDASGADADAPRLLCGMRNPQANQRAIMYVITDVNKAFDDRAGGEIELVDMFTLDLGGRGVSDLCWDPVTKGYLIVGALSNGPKLDEDRPFPPASLDSALFWWSGNKADKPRLFAKVPDMKIEAITRMGDSRYIAIASDEGDVSEGRPERQSVLTFMEFTGVKP